jgi:uncharacterized membrane protein
MERNTMKDHAGRLREEVIGDSVTNSRYVLGTVGMGFLGLILGFVPLLGLLVVITALLMAFFVLKKGITKVMAFVLAGASLATTLASYLWGQAAQANATSADFKAQTGIWSLFGFAMYPIDLTNKYIFNKTEEQTWNAKRGVVFPSTAALCAELYPRGVPASAAAALGETGGSGTCAACNAV